MNLPGFAAEGSLYISAGQYRAAATTVATFAGQVLPMTCCSDCKLSCNCHKTSLFDPVYNQCIDACHAAYQYCLDTCTYCKIHRQPCCPYNCKGTCAF